MNDERRLKRIYITSNQLINLFSKPSFMEEDGVFCFNVIHLEGLPEDVEVKNVSFDVGYNGWCLTIWSKEFDTVEKYCIIPVLQWYERMKQKTERYKKIEEHKEDYNSFFR